MRQRLSVGGVGAAPDGVMTDEHCRRAERRRLRRVFDEMRPSADTIGLMLAAELDSSAKEVDHAVP